MESEQDNPADVMLKILDRWNEEGNDSYTKLIEILGHGSIGQLALAREMTPRDPVSSGVKGNPGDQENQGCSVEKAINIILHAVREGKMVKEEAEEFAGMLNKNVKGTFKHTANQANFQFGVRTMREIFTNFEKEEAYKLSAEEKVKAIVKALQEAELGYLAHEIENA
jgi:polyhydroxyalkanoate synthesis regulator phasin